MRKKTKFLVLRGSIIAAFALLTGRLWYMQVVQNSYYTAQADTSKIRLEPVQALRGIIYDRYGHPLVYNWPSWIVTIVPHAVPRASATAMYTRLSGLLGHSPTARQIATIVRKNSFRPYTAAPIKEHVSADTAMIIKQLHGELPGVRADPVTVRHYVQDPEMSLSHLLGYASEIGADQYTSDAHSYPREHFTPTDLAGRTGIEDWMDSYLHGINDTQEVEVDAGERPVRVLKVGHPIPGDSVYLTIDNKLQTQVANDLQAALTHLNTVYHANLRQAVAVIEDVHTGAIRAMVSLPSYNNNLFAGGISEKQFAALQSDPAYPLTDLATAGQFAPGSTYKIITAAAALETHTVDASTIVDDTGAIKLCSAYDSSACQTFDGWKPGGLGPMNIVTALAESSDIYFYTVAGGDPNRGPLPHVGANRLAHWAKLFGLGAKTGIQIPYEDPGFVPSAYWYNHLPVGDIRRPDASYTWHIGDTYNMAIGQGYNLATPLQMVNVAATVANGGTLYHPTIIDHVMGRVVPRRGALRHTQTLQPFVPQIIRRNILSPSALSLIQQGMHESVTLPGWTGTSYYMKDPRIDAAGKTGTAEETNKPPHAWWLGYAPYNNPQVAIVVMVPNAGGEGAYVAAPIAHKLLEDYFHLKPITDSPSTPTWLDEVQQQLVGNGGAQ